MNKEEKNLEIESLSELEEEFENSEPEDITSEKFDMDVNEDNEINS